MHLSKAHKLLFGGVNLGYLVTLFGYLELPQVRSPALCLYLYDHNKHIRQTLLYHTQNKVPRSVNKGIHEPAKSMAARQGLEGQNGEKI